MDILQVYPRLPPAIDGIGDYSLKLAQGLRQRYGITTHFLTCRPSHQASQLIDSFPIIDLLMGDAAAFVRSVPPQINTLIIQFSDYPYDPQRGAPFWLVEALKTLKQQRPIQVLLVLHEFPSFYLLKKTFYLFPWQRSAAWQLAELADTIFTNNAATQALLASRLSQPIVNLPVFSNIGELEHPPTLEQRDRRLIVFGTAGRRARIYQRSQAALRQICHALSITEILDIGPSLQLNVSEMAGVRFRELGEQPPAVISQLMAESLAGIVYSTDNQRLAKSGVFATYCAHGLVPIVTNSDSAIADGLQAEQHFLSTARLETLTLDRLSTIAQAAYQWYAAHNQVKTIDYYAANLTIPAALNSA